MGDPMCSDETLKSKSLLTESSVEQKPRSGKSQVICAFTNSRSEKVGYRADRFRG